MKRIHLIYPIILFFLVFGSYSCKKGNKIDSQQVTLDSLHITEFALKIENAVSNGDTALYIQAFDKKGLKQKLQSNSIAYSSLDASFGQFYFDNYFSKMARSAVEAVSKGGDFKFVHYYKTGKEHHIVMRTYQDFTVNYNDWILSIVDNEIKITEGFIYNQSSTLSNDLIYYLHYHVMEITNPDGVTPNLVKANGLLQAGKEKAALKILEKNKDLLKQYPTFWQIYIGALFENDNKNFISNLEKLKTEGIDDRTIYLHKLLYYSNGGNSEATKQIIEKMIPFTGDDPIYLFLYGKALTSEEDYQNALVCFENLENVMPLLWDIWCEKLACYYQLGEVDAFKKWAVMGVSNFGLTESELLDFIQLHFPAMKKIIFFPKNEQI
ncbi:MAG TPA: hypothetical protein PLI77_02195 [Bacteroidales bacterium]|nr:hypothetical protein [Bacteroidales bacterium]